MKDFIIMLGSMSWQASIMTAVVLVFRKIFEQIHISKKYMMLLWMLPFFCLLCPWKINLPNGFWHVAPTEMSADRIAEEKTQIAFLKTEKKSEGEGSNSGDFQSVLSDSGSVRQGSAESDTDSKLVSKTHLDKQEVRNDVSSQEKEQNESISIIVILEIVWVTGVFLLFVYNLILYIKLKKKLLCSMKVDENIYVGDEVKSPMTVGVFSPRIYLPVHLPKEYEKYVTAHEQTHIKRHDIIYKMIVYMITCLHWFNPFVWYAFYLFCKDMEMTCDEETILCLGIEERRAYAEALLGVAERGTLRSRMIFTAPVTFEMGNVKSRIKNIMKYKKTVSAATVCAVTVCILSAIVFMSRESPKEERKQQLQIEKTVASDQVDAEEEPMPTYFEDNDNLTFEDLEGIEFWFGSGAGAWCTTVTIQSDGTFEGYYHDSDMGGSYMAPRGMRYECRFYGQFVSLKKTGPYEYSMKCKSLELQDPIGLEKEEDGFVVVTTDPYGFDNADEFALYLPGKNMSELPENYRAGASAGDAIMVRYGMYNIGGDQSYEVWPESDPSLYTSEPTPLPTPVPTLSPEEIVFMRTENESQDSVDFRFLDLEGMSFWSHRGGGEAWVEIEADGTFHGTFRGTSYLSPSEDYPNGVRYECRYSGRFSSAVKTGPYEYTLQCESIEIEGNVGDENIIDGVKVITTEPHGFDSAGEFKLYIPGKRILELPEEYFEWYNYLYGPEDGVSDGYILYNVGGKEFFGVPKG